MKKWGIILGLVFAFTFVGGWKKAYRIYVNAKYPFPTIMKQDEVVGWRNKVGDFEAKYPHQKKMFKVPMKIGQEGERLHALSHITRLRHDGEIVGLGGSFAFGWGVDQESPYLAQVAKRFPQYHTVNLGVGGYGTYQSLLILEDRYKNKKPPKAVIYGFGKHHEERNVASHSWRGMLYVHSRRGHAKLPYVRLAQGKVVPHAPEGDSQTPFFCRYSSTLCGYYYQYFVVPMMGEDTNKTEARIVTERLIQKMHQWTKTGGSEFMVVLMDSSVVKEYEEFFQENGIRTIKAPRWNSLSFDPHPNQEFHREVAARLVGVIRDLDS